MKNVNGDDDDVDKVQQKLWYWNAAKERKSVCFSHYLEGKYSDRRRSKMHPIRTTLVSNKNEIEVTGISYVAAYAFEKEKRRGSRSKREWHDSRQIGRLE
ncbi:hypothetical protein M0804_004888 [Polistes exclamans]|nr:hypothetical protein M0804_004888 [Polistes exclamans]